MEHGEYQPQSAASFLDVVRTLPDDEEVVLGRNKVAFVKDAMVYREQDVHYERLFEDGPYATERSAQSINGEFFEAAGRLIAIRGDSDRVVYPAIRVRNRDTERVSTRVLDLAQLIRSNAIDLYTLPARSPLGGEMVTTDISKLAKKLIGDVGINAGESMIVNGGEAVTVSAANLHSSTHLIGEYPLFSFDEPLKLDRRGVEAIDLLQIDMAEAVKNSPYMERTSERTVLDLLVATRPDVQTIMHDLIDLVGHHRLGLVYHRERGGTDADTLVLSLARLIVKGGETFIVGGQRLAEATSVDRLVVLGHFKALDYFHHMGK